MDPQPRGERIFHMRAKAAPDIQVFELLIDISDDFPPRTLIYRSNKSTASTACSFVSEHELPSEMVSPFEDYITKQTGGKQETRIVTREWVYPAERPPLPSSIAAWLHSPDCAEPAEMSMTGVGSRKCRKLSASSSTECGDLRSSPKRQKVAEEAATTESRAMGTGDTRSSSPPPPLVQVNNLTMDTGVTAPSNTPQPVEIHVLTTEELQHMDWTESPVRLSNAAASRHLTKVSRDLLGVEDRIGDLETTIDRLDIDKSDYGHEERIKALEEIVRKLTARLMKLEGGNFDMKPEYGC